MRDQLMLILLMSSSRRGVHTAGSTDTGFGDSLTSSRSTKESIWTILIFHPTLIFPPTYTTKQQQIAPHPSSTPLLSYQGAFPALSTHDR